MVGTWKRTFKAAFCDYYLIGCIFIEILDKPINTKNDLNSTKYTIFFLNINSHYKKIKVDFKIKSAVQLISINYKL